MASKACVQKEPEAASQRTGMVPAVLRAMFCMSEDPPPFPLLLLQAWQAQPPLPLLPGRRRASPGKHGVWKAQLSPSNLSSREANCLHHRGSTGVSMEQMKALLERSVDVRTDSEPTLLCLLAAQTLSLCSYLFPLRRILFTHCSFR